MHHPGTCTIPQQPPTSYASAFNRYNTYTDLLTTLLGTPIHVASMHKIGTTSTFIYIFIAKFSLALKNRSDAQ